jgi:signal transduction histidine kinase
MGTMPRSYARAGAPSSAAGQIRGLTREGFRLRLKSEVRCPHVGYVPLVSRLLPLIRRHLVDVLIVLAAVECALEVALRDDALRAPRSSPWFAVPAAAMVVLPLLWRRRWPFGAPIAVFLIAAVVSLIDGRLVTFAAGSSAAGVAAAFLLGQLPDVRQARIGLVVAVASAALIVFNDPTHLAGEPLFVPVTFAIGWLAGFALRERSVEAEAAQERAAMAEREREAAARIAVAEERARIARELHDIVAHAVSVIVLQVGAIRHNLPAAMADDKEALHGIERTGRTALADMRRLLAAMRDDGEDPDLAPQPGLARLDPLLDEVRRAGLPVKLAVEGDPVPLPRALDLSAYRVVQEGLTNALKHAHAGHADVTLRYRPGRLEVAVRDDGHGTASPDGLGHGLVGVRERVKIYGGEMTAGAAEGGGFMLATSFPLEGEGR